MQRVCRGFLVRRKLRRALKVQLLNAQAQAANDQIRISIDADLAAEQEKQKQNEDRRIREFNERVRKAVRLLLGPLLTSLW